MPTHLSPSFHETKLFRILLTLRKLNAAQAYALGRYLQARKKEKKTDYQKSFSTPKILTEEIYLQITFDLVRIPTYICAGNFPYKF